MTHHVLKLAPVWFDAKIQGLKPWELRAEDDRTFTPGDTVSFWEWLDGHHTGRTFGPVTITWILNGWHELMLPKTCIFTHTMPAIHPAKNPMVGGFSLYKFMPSLTPEDAEAIGEMLDDMRAEKLLNGWIPCSKRLPEPDQEVLIYLDGDSEWMLELGYTSLITIATYLGEMGDDECDWDADANAPIEDGCEPTHWRPLPIGPVAHGGAR